MNTIAFVTHVGGIAKTWLVYHLAWMYAELGLSVVAADLDSLTTLTSMFVDDERLEALWSDDSHAKTILGAIQPLLNKTGDIVSPHVENITNHIGLLVGDPGLLAWEDELTDQWRDCLESSPRAFREVSAIWRVIEQAAIERDASVVLIDVGPSLGAVNRAGLIAAEHVVIPLAPDLYSLYGLRNLGPVLRRWRQEWCERRQRNPVSGLSIPSGAMTPSGYILTQHGARLDRSVKEYDRLRARIAEGYREAVLDEPPGVTVMDRMQFLSNARSSSRCSSSTKAESQQSQTGDVMTLTPSRNVSDQAGELVPYLIQKRAHSIFRAALA